jgi:anti-anti-sigma factor
VPDTHIERLPSGIWIVAMSGEHDFTTASSLRDELEALLAAAPRVLIDLTDVTLLDSATIGVLVDVVLEAQRREPPATIVLVAAPGSAPERILIITGLSKLLASVHPSREQGLKAFH